MNNLLLNINRILQQEDIEGLIETGAPSDEYLSEAEAISLIISNMTEPNLVNFEDSIFELWESIFNLSDSDMNLRRESIHRVTVALQELRALK